MTYARLASDAGTSGAASAVSASWSTRTRVAPCSGSTPAVPPVATTTGSAASAMIHPSRSAG